MVLPNDLRARRYQSYKDVEAFGQVAAGTTVGSVVLVQGTPLVGDFLIFNAGSTDIHYNLFTSGETVVASTSGTLLEAGGKIVYEDSGFDQIGTITAAGASDVYVQKVYSSRD